MKKIIIHAGPHKTGSTYIQKLLHDSRVFLLQNKISYPNAYYLFLGHHYLLNALNGIEKPKIIYSTISKEAIDSDYIILSSENFISLTKSGLKKLKDTFPDKEFVFILYMRCPSVRLISWWQEIIKQGGIRSLEDFFLDHLLNPMKSRDINMQHYINDVIAIFGEDAIKLVDYDTAVKDKKIMELFWISTGLPNLIEDTDEKINQMMSLAEIELIRYLNIRAKQENFLEGANVREAYFRMHTQLVPSVKSFIQLLETNISRDIVLGDSTFDHEVYQNINNRLKNYLVNESSTPAPKDYKLPDRNWMFNSEIIAIANQIYQDFKERFKTEYAFCQIDNKYYVQMFVDTGGGYSEEQSLFAPYMPQEDVVFDVVKYRELRTFRIDPLNDAVVLDGVKVSCVFDDGSTVEIFPEGHNAVIDHEGCYYFLTYDPQLVYAPDALLADRIRQVRFRAKYSRIGDAAIALTEKSLKKSQIQEDLQSAIH